jgi:K+-transporting ATPase KdpF subunit
MPLDIILGALTAFGLLAYLGTALIRPENF